MSHSVEISRAKEGNKPGELGKFSVQKEKGEKQKQKHDHWTKLLAEILHNQNTYKNGWNLYLFFFSFLFLPPGVLPGQYCLQTQTGVAGGPRTPFTSWGHMQAWPLHFPSPVHATGKYKEIYLKKITVTVCKYCHIWNSCGANFRPSASIKQSREREWYEKKKRQDIWTKCGRARKSELQKNV